MSNATQQEIDVGAVANDGTGESLRDAFNAVNNNFANIWAQGPVGTNVLIRNNEVTTDVTNLDLKIAGNGVGNVVVASTLQPTIDGVYDLGRSTRRFGDVYGTYFYGNGAFLTGLATANAFATIDANGVLITANTSSTVTIDAGNNITITANAATSTIDFAVDDNPTFANVTATNFNGVSLAVSDATVYGNVDALQGNFTNLITTPAANIGNLNVSGHTIAAATANTSITLQPTGTGVVSATANVVAPYFIGNIVGNISGNITVPGANTQVIFNDNGQAGASANFEFDKASNILSVTGNVTATNLNGTGYGISNVLADRGGDTTNWNVLLAMGTYTVNRVNWGGVTGAPLDSTVYVGLLEVKAANTQGAVLSVEQNFYPGTIDSNDVRIQYNRSYWSGSWTPWVRMTNDGQPIDGGSF